MDKIQENFLKYASDILADTDNGLTGSQIVEYFVKKSVVYNVDIVHSKQPFINDENRRINKRTAFFDNLVCFPPQLQYEIITDLCNTYDKEGFADLMKLTKERYGSNENNQTVEVSQTHNEQIQVEQISSNENNIQGNENKITFYDGIVKYAKSNFLISILLIASIVIAFLVTLFGGIKSLLPVDKTEKIIQGKLYNENNEPVKNALVEIIGYKGKTSYTDDLGTFFFRIKDKGIVDIEFRISHKEYKTKNLKDEINFSVDKKHELTILLEKKNPDREETSLYWKSQAGQDLQILTLSAKNL